MNLKGSPLLTESTVYPKKYAYGFCFAVLCCGHTLTDFPISIRLTSLALWQSNDCPSASKATLMNMDKYFMWIHYERLHNHNKAKHNKTVCIFLGIYCSSYGIVITPWINEYIHVPLRWRHNDHTGVSNHQPHGCLLNRLFRRKSKKTSKLRVTGLCVGNSPGTGEFPAQMASYAENVSIWWRHHDTTGCNYLSMCNCKTAAEWNIRCVRTYGWVITSHLLENMDVITFPYFKSS